MNNTIDYIGADWHSINQTYTEESHPKYINFSQLLHTRKKPGFSFCHITQRDYYPNGYIPTRSPPSLQLQIQNFQLNAVKLTRKKKMTTLDQKCKTLPVNDISAEEINKRIQEKQKLLEEMYLPKERSVTCAIYIPQQLRKTQDLQHPSRVSTAYQRTRKISILKPNALTLGLNIEKCKLVERLNSPLTSVAKKRPFRNLTIVERCQKIIQKPIPNCLGKKTSIPLSKWENSDGEN